MLATGFVGGEQRKNFKCGVGEKENAGNLRKVNVELLCQKHPVYPGSSLAHLYRTPQSTAISDNTLSWASPTYHCMFENNV